MVAPSTLRCPTISGGACKAIAAFLTETITAAHHASFVFTEFSPENGCVLESAGQKLMPDCRFALEDRRGRRYRFYVPYD